MDLDVSKLIEEARTPQDHGPHKRAGTPDLSDPAAASLWNVVRNDVRDGRRPHTPSKLECLRSENAELKAQIERSRQETERLRKRVHDLLVKLRAGELREERAA